MPTKTEVRTAEKISKRTADRQRNEKNQKEKIERDKKIITINTEFDTKIRKLNVERSEALKRIWDEWYAR